ncbi:hypothetical protein C3L33_07614, partial [Rhododendron williamsianum]
MQQSNAVKTRMIPQVLHVVHRQAPGNHVALIQECKDLVMYAIFNAVAMRKILKKYDKLMAFHINMRETKPQQRKASALFDGCSLVINEGKPSLHCELFDSIKLDIDLTCSVCLAGLYEGAVHLDELNILLSRSCPEYWEERLQAERVERIQQAKEHWESQCRAFMGV